jgi:hypothetical protein
MLGGCTAGTSCPAPREGAAAWAGSGGQGWVFGGTAAPTGWLDGKHAPLRVLHDLWSFNGDPPPLDSGAQKLSLGPRNMHIYYTYKVFPGPRI